MGTTPTTNSNTQLEKTVAVVKTKFDILQTESKQITVRCLAVKVTDSISLDLARQIVNNANDLNKRIEEMRVTLKAPYLTIGKEIDNAAKIASGDLDKAIQHIKSEFDTFNKAEAERAIAQKAEIEKKKATLDKYDAQLREKSNNCKTADECQQLINSIKEKFPAPEAFGPYAEDSVFIKQGFIDYLTGKIENFNGNGKAAAIEAKEEITIAKENIEAKHEVIQSQIVATKSKIRKTPKFNIIDENLVDRTFLSVDESKIRQYINANKAMLSENKFVFGGVEFWIEETPVLG